MYVDIINKRNTSMADGNQSYHFWLHTKILGRSHIDAVRLLVNKNMRMSFAFLRSY
jgi:hypothetical protein